MRCPIVSTLGLVLLAGWAFGCEGPAATPSGSAAKEVAPARTARPPTPEPSPNEGAERHAESTDAASVHGQLFSDAHRVEAARASEELRARPVKLPMRQPELTETSIGMRLGYSVDRLGSVRVHRWSMSHSERLSSIVGVLYGCLFVQVSGAPVGRAYFAYSPAGVTHVGVVETPETPLRSPDPGRVTPSEVARLWEQCPEVMRKLLADGRLLPGEREMLEAISRELALRVRS